MAWPGLEWLELAARWLHVVAAIAWVGTSFYFIQLSSVLKPPREPSDVAGEAWQVHGGGFFRMSKFAVAPPVLPETLHWFKWEAYATWASGGALLVLVYYVRAEAFLVDRAAADLSTWAAIGIAVGSIFAGKAVYEAMCRSPLVDRPRLFAAVGLVLGTALAYALGEVISDRAAWLHVGATIGTIMASNVLEVIIPSQKQMVRAIEAGGAADPAKGKAAARRSLHNNYLALPVVLIMISPHYPGTYGHPHGWLLLGALAATGGWIRHYYNLRHRGIHRPWILVTAALAFVAIALLAARTGAAGTPSEGPPVSLEEIRPIVAQRCAVCHSADPVYAGFDAPPKGVAFDTPEEIRARAASIYEFTVATRVMPLGNLTDMTEEERERLGRWARSEGAETSDLEGS